MKRQVGGARIRQRLKIATRTTHQGDGETGRVTRVTPSPKTINDQMIRLRRRIKIKNSKETGMNARKIGWVAAWIGMATSPQTIETPT
jgi:hypothetical protein